MKRGKRNYTYYFWGSSHACLFSIFFGWFWISSCSNDRFHSEFWLRSPLFIIDKVARLLHFLPDSFRVSRLEHVPFMYFFGEYSNFQGLKPIWSTGNVLVPKKNIQNSMEIGFLFWKWQIFCRIDDCWMPILIDTSFSKNHSNLLFPPSEYVHWSPMSRATMEMLFRSG